MNRLVTIEFNSPDDKYPSSLRKIIHTLTARITGFAKRNGNYFDRRFDAYVASEIARKMKEVKKYMVGEVRNGLGEPDIIKGEKIGYSSQKLGKLLNKIQGTPHD